MSDDIGRSVRYFLPHQGGFSEKEYVGIGQERVLLGRECVQSMGVRGTLVQARDGNIGRTL